LLIFALSDETGRIPWAGEILPQRTHTFWFLPSVASCYAMKDLMQERQNKFYQDYNIVVAAGTKAGIGVDAIKPVQKAMGNPLETKTITLSTGKLTTGVSIKPWSGVFMFRRGRISPQRILPVSKINIINSTKYGSKK